MTVRRDESAPACPAWAPRLEAYVDGEADPREADVVRDHLRHCVACRTDAAALASLNGVLRDLARPDPAAEAVWARVARRLEETSTGERASAGWTMSRRFGAPIQGRTAAALAACTVAVVLLIGALAGRLMPMGAPTVVAASVQDFVTYRARGWTLDHASSDAGALTAWAQPRVNFAVPAPRPRLGELTVAGIRLCWLLERRLIGLSYTHGAARAVVYVMERDGLAVPRANTRIAGDIDASIHHHKGHGVAVWSNRDLVFVLVAAEDDFARLIADAGGGRVPDPGELPARG